jgi:hypothetical protein
MNIRLGDLRGGTIKLVLTIMGLNFELHMNNLYFFCGSIYLDSVSDVGI